MLIHQQEMRPFQRWIDQTDFGFTKGNCFSACVASLLGVDLVRVPFFMDSENDWFEEFKNWLIRRFMMYPTIFLYEEVHVPPGYYILSGISPRSLRHDEHHSVVAMGKIIIHDPHPSRAGLVTRHDMIVFSPIDPLVI